jgi:hypothetical protein
MIVRGKDVGDIRNPDPCLLDGAVKGGKRPGVVRVQEKITAGARDQEGVRVAISKPNHGNRSHIYS